jgi:hypothetical protein
LDAGDTCELANAGDSVVACGFDQQAPQITSVAFSATDIYTAASDRTVSVDMHVNDDLLGAQAVYCAYQLETGPNTVSVTLPSGMAGMQAATLVSGTNVDGTYRCTVTFPQGIAQGQWMPSVSVKDGAGRWREFTAYHLSDWQTAFPSAPTRIVQHDPGDTTAPEIAAYSGWSRSSINTSVFPKTLYNNGSSRLIVVYVDVRDDMSGAGSLSCTLTQNAYPFDIGGAGAKAVKVSGTHALSRWKCAMHMSDYSEKGNWYLKIDATDLAGNAKHIKGVAPGTNEAFNGSTLTATEATGLGTNFIAQIGNREAVAPVISGVSISPTTINTSTRAQTVNFTFSVKETGGSGFSGVGCGLSLDIPGQSVPVAMWGNIFKRISGTTANGRWRCSVVLPRGSARGDWVPSVTATDRAHNSGVYVGPMPVIHN